MVRMDLHAGERDRPTVVALRAELDATALVLVREQARRAGGDLLLAAPGDQVTRVLTLTCLIDVLSVHASAGHAADTAGRRLAARPVL